MSKKFLTTTLAAATVLSVSALPASHLLSQQASGNTVQAATNDNAQFIERIAPYAQAQAMNYGVYPSVMMAQAILESAWGTSALGQAPNYNLFGIKGSYQGQSVMMPTSEWDYNAGKYIQIQAPFRKYPDFGASFGDNGDKLRNGLTTNSKFYNGTWIENTTSYQDSTKWLTGRYATSPTYNTNLNRVIETYNLTRFDPQVTSVNGQVQTKTTANLYNTYTGVKTKSNSATAGQVFSINQKVVLPDNSIYYRLTNNLWVSDKDVTSNISQGPINNQNTQSTADKAQNFAPFSKGAQLNSNVSGYQLSSDNTFSASKQLTSQHVQLTTKATTTQGVVYYLSSTNGVWIKASDLTLDKEVSQAPENPVNKTTIESKDMRMQDNYNIYSLSGNTFSLSSNTNNFSEKNVKAIQKATQGNRTYYLLSDGQKELGWIDQTGVIDGIKVVEDFYNKQPVKITDLTPRTVTIKDNFDMMALKDNLFSPSINTSSLSNKTVTITKQAVKDHSIFFLATDGQKELGWIGQVDLDVHTSNRSDSLITQDVTPQKVSVNTGAKSYYLMNNGFVNAGEKLSASMTVIKNASKDGISYSLLSNDGKTPVAWVQSSDVKDASTTTPQSSDNKVTTQTVTPQKVTVNSGAANYYLMNNGFVNAGEKLPSSMTVIQTATKGSTQYSLLSTDGKTPFAWVQSSDVKAANNTQQSTDNKVTTQDASGHKVTVNASAKTYYLMPNGFVEAGEKSPSSMTVIKTATKGSIQYSLLSQDGKTPFAWVQSSDIKSDSTTSNTADNTKVTTQAITPKSVKVAPDYNTYYLLSSGFSHFGNSSDFTNSQFKVIQTATQGNKNYSLLSTDGQVPFAWVSSEAVSDSQTTAQTSTNTSANIALTDVSQSATVVNGGNAFYLTGNNSSLALTSAGKSDSYTGSVQVIKKATQNGKNYYLVSTDGRTGLAWIDEAGLYFGGNSNQSSVQITKEDGQPVWVQQSNPMFQLRNNKFEPIQGNGSSANDSYLLTETAKVGQTTYYHVSKNGGGDDFWTTTLKFQSGRFTNPISVSGVAKINYIPGYSIRVWDQDQKPTDNFLKHGTEWRILGEAHSDGKTYYQVGLNQWIDGQYVQLSNYHRFN
ncbi:glucosaminidase domain-containing protein [Holzapfeliella sp. JNUCC 80]